MFIDHWYSSHRSEAVSRRLSTSATRYLFFMRLNHVYLTRPSSIPLVTYLSPQTTSKYKGYIIQAVGRHITKIVTDLEIETSVGSSRNVLHADGTWLESR